MAASTSTVSPPQIVFAQEQLEVIDEPTGKRQLVEAGPGTGKTAVACARIAKLLRDGINSSEILVVSFTRAAVREMRDRIRGWSGMESSGGLHILTVDQTAFRFAKGAGSDSATLLQGFDVTMAEAIKQLLVGQGDITRYVASLKHVLVDEAQDLTDMRSEFVEGIIASLPTGSGATIMADHCQAVYGFTHDQGEDNTKAPRTFLASFPFEKTGFVRRSLTLLHRTKDKKLSAFFAQTRTTLVAAKGRADFDGMIDQIRKGGNELGDKIDKFGLNDGDMVLFRRRAQALHAANFFNSVHRLRLPGYPAPVYPWVALCLSGFHGRSLSEAEFSGFWSEHVPGGLADGWTPSRAFEALRSTSGSTRQIDMRRLRGVLSQARPPIELCYPDFGGFGPIFSTIHAAKGREADRVILMLPRDVENALERMKGSEQSILEEARVYYVGATRVRRDFAHGIAATLVDTRKLKPDNDREVGIPFKPDGRAKFQFGRIGDIDESRLVSVRSPWCGDEAQAVKRQRGLVELWKSSVDTGIAAQVFGKRGGNKVGDEWRYTYEFLSGEQTLGWAGETLVHDLFALAKTVASKAGGIHRPPKAIPFLKLIGLRSVVVSDDAAMGELCAPYSESGIFLAPMIVGFANFKTISLP